METIPISQKEAYKVNIDGSNISMEFWSSMTLNLTFFIFIDIVQIWIPLRAE